MLHKNCTETEGLTQQTSQKFCTSDIERHLSWVVRLRVSREAQSRCWLEQQTSQDLTGTGGSACKLIQWLLAGGLSALLHVDRSWQEASVPHQEGLFLGQRGRWFSQSRWSRTEGKQEATVLFMTCGLKLQILLERDMARVLFSNISYSNVLLGKHGSMKHCFQAIPFIMHFSNHTFTQSTAVRKEILDTLRV